MTIKHLVIGGGGPAGLIMYGSLKTLHKKGVWDFKNIESIFSTSIGCWLAIVVLARLDWDWIDDFFIKRPWEKLINVSAKDYLNIFNNKGHLDRNLLLKCVLPLLNAGDFAENITMKELYDKTSVDLHIFTANINSPYVIEEIDISYKTHPDLCLIDAMLRSCCIPGIFKPIFEDNKCFIDGGILNNYPVNSCLKYYPDNKKEILAFKFNRGVFERKITNETPTIEYLLYMFNAIVTKLLIVTSNLQEEIPYKIECVCDKSIGSFTYWLEAFSNQSERQYLIETGNETGEKFFAEYYMDFYIEDTPIEDTQIEDTEIDDNKDDIKENKDEFSNID